MAERPDKLPRWAEDDVTDPVSGQQNVDEPPEERQDSGWERNEKPPRQWFNWLQRGYYRWLRWIVEERLDKATHEAIADRLAQRDGSGRLESEPGGTDKQVLTDSDSSTSATAGSLARRDANGRTEVQDPAADLDAANKGYVDEGDADTLASAEAYTDQETAEVQQNLDDHEAEAVPTSGTGTGPHGTRSAAGEALQRHGGRVPDTDRGNDFNRGQKIRNATGYSNFSGGLYLFQGGSEDTGDEANATYVLSTRNGNRATIHVNKNAATEGLEVRTNDGGSDFNTILELRPDGAMRLSEEDGTPAAGGFQGPGTINAKGLFVEGVPVGGALRRVMSVEADDDSFVELDMNDDFKNYVVVADGLRVSSAGTNLVMRVLTESSGLVTGDNYSWHRQERRNYSSTYSGSAPDERRDSLTLLLDVDNQGNQFNLINGTVTLIGARQDNTHKHITWDLCHRKDASGTSPGEPFVQALGLGAVWSSSTSVRSPISGVRIYPSSGTLTRGRLTLYGIEDGS